MLLLEFKRSNITKTWKLDANSPFKEVDMIEILERWSPLARSSRGNHFLTMVEFLRFYLRHACEPPHEIQHFACRQFGRQGRNPHLLDFPKPMIVFLTNFVLDAFGLFADELLLSAYECATYANSYWRTLEENDDERAKRFDSMVKAKITWKEIVRTAIGRAL
ncbi:unnamed protein product [Cylicocyclus nassatus]|uniref:Uncharacterized protein n=1 Tax=Cylicocyclus nassatus TaxID=53992 RepID=A0AA36GT74_CYLNA|nr:unnamed protein product [Cylicocyclus nassatus]